MQNLISPITTAFSSVFNPIKDRLNSKIPSFLNDQALSIESKFPYENFLDDDNSNIILLTDGGLGICWKICTIEHEIYNDLSLTDTISRFCKVFESVSTERASFQIIWDSYPDRDFEVPEHYYKSNVIAHNIMCERFDKIKSLADNPGSCLKAMKRELFLTFRLQPEKRIDFSKRKKNLISEFNEQFENLEMLISEFRKYYESIEISLQSGGYVINKLNKKSFIEFVRIPFHTYEFKKNNACFYQEIDEENSISNQILKDYLVMTPRYIEVGQQDTWEVLSWSGISKNQYAGMMSQLMQIDIPMRAVVNIVPCKEKDEKSIEFKETLLLRATSSKSLKQKKEVQETQNRIAYGEKLFRVSMHIFIRNTNIDLKNIKKKSSEISVINLIKNYIGIPFIAEKYAAPAIFLQCQPLAYTNYSGAFSLRERRMTSQYAAYYLPIFGGFSGHKQKTQLMQSRSGTPIWIAPRQSTETAHHVGVIAGSGAGKSFITCNLITSEVAADPRTLVFGIDYECSYEFLGKFLSDERGYTVCKPPETFPNIFLGEMDKYRINMIVNILITAIRLIDPQFNIIPEHKMIIQFSLEKVFHSNKTDANTEYDSQNNIFKNISDENLENYEVPKLSDIVKKFGIVCTEQNYPSELASILANKLSPYYGRGYLSHIFDQKLTANLKDPSPQFMFFDLSGVKTDELLCPLTAIICLSEILRNIRKKENIFVPGIIVVDELGIIGNIPAVAAFIQDAWATFRKLRQMCIGITNDVDHYQVRPACKTVWNISPNKYILHMPAEQISKAVTDAPKLFEADVGNIVSSLRKLDGAFSQGLIMSDHGCGTFMYVPTGFDYWLAVSQPIEKSNLLEILNVIGNEKKNYFKILKAISEYAPFGFRDEDKRCRKVNEKEINEIIGIYNEIN